LKAALVRDAVAAGLAKDGRLELPSGEVIEVEPVADGSAGVPVQVGPAGW